MLWYKVIVPGNHILLSNISKMKPIFWTCNYAGKEKVYQRRLKVAGMGNKLISTQVTAMNPEREGPASVSHCKCLKCPEQHHKPREWPTNILEKGAKAIYNLTFVMVLLKGCPYLTNHANFT